MNCVINEYSPAAQVWRKTRSRNCGNKILIMYIKQYISAIKYLTSEFSDQEKKEIR